MVLWLRNPKGSSGKELRRRGVVSFAGAWVGICQGRSTEGRLNRVKVLAPGCQPQAESKGPDWGRRVTAQPSWPPGVTCGWAACGCSWPRPRIWKQRLPGLCGLGGEAAAGRRPPSSSLKWEPKLCQGPSYPFPEEGGAVGTPGTAPSHQDVTVWPYPWLYSWPLNNADLNWACPLIHGFSSINILEDFFGDLRQLEKTRRRTFRFS